MDWKTEKFILGIEEKTRNILWPVSRQLFKMKRFGGQLVLENINFVKKPSLLSRNFSKASLIRANFSGLELRGILFNKAKLHNAHFLNANLEYSEFRGADLRGSNFIGANLFKCDFKNAIITDLPLPSRDKLLIAMGECLISEYKKDCRWGGESRVVAVVGWLINAPELGGPLIRIVLPELNYIAITRNSSIYLADLLTFLAEERHLEFREWMETAQANSIERLEKMVWFLKYI